MNVRKMNVLKTLGSWALFLCTWGFVFWLAYLPEPLPPIIQTPWGEEQVLRGLDVEEAAKVYARFGCKYVEETATAARNNSVPVGLLAALVIVESTCDPDAISKTGALGLTQVQPRVWKFKPCKLLEPEFNLAAGASILHDGIARYGLEGGLERYYGHDVPGSWAYVRKVLRVWRRK